jgi:hypothetical protein
VTSISKKKEENIFISISLAFKTENLSSNSSIKVLMQLLYSLNYAPHFHLPLLKPESENSYLLSAGILIRPVLSENL